MLKTLKPTLRGLCWKTALSVVLPSMVIQVSAEEALALAANADEKVTPAVAPEPEKKPVTEAQAVETTPPTAPATPAVETPATTPSVSDAADQADREARKAEINSKVRNPTLQKHLLENIDIFGKNDLPAIYILGPGIDEFEGQLLTRDFVRDPYFMQNIDREEFEMKMWLRGDIDDNYKKSKEEEKKP